MILICNLDINDISKFYHLPHYKMLSLHHYVHIYMYFHYNTLQLPPHPHTHLSQYPRILVPMYISVTPPGQVVDMGQTVNMYKLLSNPLPPAARQTCLDHFGSLYRADQNSATESFTSNSLASTKAKKSLTWQRQSLVIQIITCMMVLERGEATQQSIRSVTVKT